MSLKRQSSRPKPRAAKEELQAFIKYSVTHYDEFGRVLARALKTKSPEGRK